MPALPLLALQIASSFAVLGLLASTVVAPRLRRLPTERQLVALLWIHAPRYIPLALLAPGQTDSAVAPSVASTIAWGDFICCVLALAAIVALQLRGRDAFAWVWLFSSISTLDIVVALAIGLGGGVHNHALGVSWYVLTLYVPLVCVSQLMIVMTLRSRVVAGGAA